MTADFFAPLYSGNRRSLNVPNYAPPDQFTHGEWSLVAHCPADPPGGDGFDVRVHEIRYPATFYRIDVLPTKSSTGKKRAGCTLSTGSGAHELVSDMVRALTTGMLTVRSAK